MTTDLLEWWILQGLLNQPKTLASIPPDPHLQSNTSKNKVTQFAINDALLGLRQLAPQVALLDALEGLIQRLALRQAQAEFDPFRLHLVYSSSEWLAVLDSLSTSTTVPSHACSNCSCVWQRGQMTCSGGSIKQRHHAQDTHPTVLEKLRTSNPVEQCLHLEMTDCSPGALDFVRKALQGLH